MSKTKRFTRMFGNGKLARGEMTCQELKAMHLDNFRDSQDDYKDHTVTEVAAMREE